MAWCHQATSQCWPRSMMPYYITRPQWVNFRTKESNWLLWPETPCPQIFTGTRSNRCFNAGNFQHMVMSLLKINAEPPTLKNLTSWITHPKFNSFCHVLGILIWNRRYGKKKIRILAECIRNQNNFFHNMFLKFRHIWRVCQWFNAKER